MTETYDDLDTPSIAPPPPPGAPDRAGPATTETEPARRAGVDPRVLHARGLGPGPPRKSPALASMLSMLPGIGQVYVGYYKLGFVHNIVFGLTIAALTYGDGPVVFPFLGIFLGFFWVYNIVDAGRRAVFYNLALDGVEGIELPPDMNVALPSFGGSIGGGVSLITVGFILLLNTRFGVSLEWLEAWWPVAPMMLGVYLVFKAVQDRGREAPTAVES